jgi:hypothetical protein
MPPTPDELRADLALALDTLKSKQHHAALYLSYYDGDNPLPYISERLRDIFAGLNTEFRMNWCAPVINACADRINLTGFVLPNDALQRAFDEQLLVTDLLLEADDAHKHALVTGQAFVIVGQDADTQEIEVFYNPSHACHLFYEAENPNRKRMAAKWWCDGDERYIKLYYADSMYTFVADEPKEGLSKLDAGKFDLVPDESNVNPYGLIPVWELRPERRGVVSDIKPVTPIADAINALFINTLVVGEYNAFRQKYIISSTEIAGALRSAPDTILDIPAAQQGEQDTQVGEFSETNMENYTKTIDGFVSSIAAITQTPMHYFFKAGGVPSGEALIALEAPLNKKAQDRINRFAPVWRQVAAFVCRLMGYSDVRPQDITPQFERPETVQPKTQSEIRYNNNRAGIPIVASLRMEGAPQSVIDEVERAQAGEALRNTEQLRRAFDAGAGGASDAVVTNE